MKVLKGYVFRQVLYGSLLVLVVLLGLFMLFELIYQLGKIGPARGVVDAIYRTFLEVPVDLVEILPIAVVGGTAMSLGTMAVHSELSVILTLGHPQHRLFRLVLLPSGIFILMMIVLNEGFIPMTEKRLNAFAERQKTGFSVVESNIWMREENKFIYAGYLLDDRYHDVSIYEYSDDHTRFETITTADFMEISETQLHLSGVRVAQISHDQIVFTPVKDKLIKRTWEAGGGGFRIPPPNTLNSLQLQQQIAALKRNHLDSRIHELELWKRFAEPLSILVLLTLVVPFCFQVRRDRNAWFYLLFGVGSGLAYLLIDRVISTWGLVHQFPPLLVAFATLILFTLAALVNYRLRNQRA